MRQVSTDPKPRYPRPSPRFSAMAPELSQGSVRIDATDLDSLSHGIYGIYGTYGTYAVARRRGTLLVREVAGGPAP